MKTDSAFHLGIHYLIDLPRQRNFWFFHQLDWYSYPVQRG